MECAGSLLEEAVATVDRLEWSNASASPQSGTIPLAFLRLQARPPPWKRLTAGCNQLASASTLSGEAERLQCHAGTAGHTEETALPGAGASPPQEGAANANTMTGGGVTGGAGTA